MQRELLLARHGESFGNVCKIIEGHSDIAGLTPRGIEQAELLGAYLQHEGINLIISGDLERQMQTAKIVNSYVRKDIVSTTLLRERSAGIYDLAPYSAINATDFNEAQSSYSGFIHGSEQETLDEVLHRVHDLHDQLLHFSEEKILLVGSSWINSYFLNLFLDAGKNGVDFYTLREQKNASVHRLTLDYRLNLLDAELNILPPERLALDKSNEKLLKPVLVQDAYGSQRKTG